MTRAWLLIALAACSRGGSVTDSGAELHYDFRSGGENWYLDLDVKLPRPPGGDGTEVKAACQTADARLIDVTPPTNGAAFKDTPFLIIHTLPAKPAFCEITLRQQAKIVAQFCIGEPTKPGACPANKLVPEAGPTGIRVDLISVKGEPADDIGFPAHLTVSYRATATRDMVRGAYLVRTTSCPGRRSDTTWHSELQDLSTGESFDAAQNTYKLGRPDPAEKCETTLGYSPRVDGDITEIATFCHIDGKIGRGHCP